MSDTPRTDAAFHEFSRGLEIPVEIALHAFQIERELEHAKADASSWQQQAEQRLNDANEWGRRAEKAEARVAELEGLRITGTHFFSDFVGVAVNLPLGSEPTIGGTLGQAMPAKEWGPYKLQPDGFYRLQSMPGGGK